MSAPLVMAAGRLVMAAGRLVMAARRLVMAARPLVMAGLVPAIHAYSHRPRPMRAANAPP